MRLSRIIAERFGSLRSATLGPLGDGLTVVLGPNEAGKTSFTTLVRYVLYGYPTKRDAEPDYECDAGKRLGRLVFSDGDSQWALERAEGTHGGQLAVSTLAGPDRHELLSEVTRGVSRDSFRVVFGFGLDEMVQIEAGRGAGMDILSKLYAAKVGLEVSPSDVRAGLESEASELWRPSGRNPELNALKAKITEVKRQITDLESQASRFAQDQERLTEIGEQLESARANREAATLRAQELGTAAQKLTDLETRIAEATEQAHLARQDASADDRKRAAILVDERLLAVAAELGEVLSESSGFRERLRRASEQELEISSLRARAALKLTEAAVEASDADAADLGPETTAGLERWKTRLVGLESQAAMSRRAADAAKDATEPAGSQSDKARRATSGSRLWAPGALLVALGLVIVVVAGVAADLVQAVLGLLVTGTGVALLVRVLHPQTSASSALSNERITGQVGATELAAKRDAAELLQASDEWRTWLSARGLGHAGDDPTAASLLLGSLKEYRALVADADRVAVAREQELAACAAYRAQLASLTEHVTPALSGVEFEDIPVQAARLSQDLQAARAADVARRELSTRIASHESTASQADARLALATQDRSSLLDRLGLAASDAALVAAEAARANESARAATEAFDGIASEHTALATRLDNEGRDSAMATLRLELSGLHERRDSALERYAVLALAEKLMAHTQAFTEQARQPQVVRRASELFESITEGRYVSVSVPSDGGEFIVFDPDSRPRPSSELSTGTAQQLYLALRIALIETLDEVGPGLPVLMDDVLVNFDPERKRGAAQAIRHLAAHRQVVLFTCHPETARLMQEVAPDHTQLALERC
ncbi:MAG: AAA family ATPase [Actinobacteria bacterium]|nr:AAA family ATPase [Actinomycetota bacterium]MCG2807808.1 AAA family ATPase [Coriobacteriia bacterium]